MASRTKRPRLTPPCPACAGKMRPKPAQNATSRFVKGLYICPQCGVREAIGGNWWQSTPRHTEHASKQQEQWVKDADG